MRVALLFCDMDRPATPPLRVGLPMPSPARQGRRTSHPPIHLSPATGRARLFDQSAACVSSYSIP